MSSPPRAALDVDAAMDRALDLAARPGGRTSPNPMVGAVALAPDGRALAEAFHLAPGEPHAEAALLDEAARRGVDLRGATLVVNLEPCAHHGRTPPCAPRIADAGFRRVVAAIPDPNPLVGGAGLAALRASGIRVETAAREREATRLNEGFLTWIVEGRPFVHLKVAMLPDGTVDRGEGLPREISGTEARRRAHLWRHRAAAVLVGAGTLRTDDPLLTVRELPPDADVLPWQPLRVVLSSGLDVPPNARALRRVGDGAPPLVIGGGDAPTANEQGLRDVGVDVARVGRGADGRVDLGEALRLLGTRAVTSVLVEGGPRLADALLAAGLVDRLSVIVAGAAAGKRSFRAVDAPARSSGARAGARVWVPPGGLPFSGANLTDVERAEVGGDLLVTGLVRRGAPA